MKLNRKSVLLVVLPLLVITLSAFPVRAIAEEQPVKAEGRVSSKYVRTHGAVRRQATFEIYWYACPAGRGIGGSYSCLAIIGCPLSVDRLQIT
jgi:hypothetical protein